MPEITKQSLHNQLANVTDEPITIPESDFISVYGNNRTSKIQGQQRDRAYVLANTYNLQVTRQGSDYLFERQ